MKHLWLRTGSVLGALILGSSLAWAQGANPPAAAANPVVAPGATAEASDEEIIEKLDQVEKIDDIPAYMPKWEREAEIRTRYDRYRRSKQQPLWLRPRQVRGEWEESPPAPQRNPVLTPLEGFKSADSSELFYLGTDFADPVLAGQRGKRVGELIQARRFAAAYALESRGFGETRRLWMQRLGAAPEAVEAGADQAVRFTQNDGAVTGTPHVSPDGRWVALLGATGGGITPEGDLVLIDRQKREVRHVNVAYPDVRGLGINWDVSVWSPDSRYLSYFTGGDDNGSLSEEVGNEVVLLSLDLWIYDTQTGKSQRIEQRTDSMNGPVTWLAPHTLLYGKSVLGKPPSPQNPQREETLQVYACEPGSAPRPFLKDAYNPIASADGEWIAFWGSEHLGKTLDLSPRRRHDSQFFRQKAQGLRLSVVRRDGTGRKVLEQTSDTYPQLVWHLPRKS